MAMDPMLLPNTENLGQLHNILLNSISKNLFIWLKIYIKDIDLCLYFCLYFGINGTYQLSIKLIIIIDKFDQMTK